MGNFYVNFTVKSDASQPVVYTLKRAQLNAIVTTPSRGGVVVFEEGSDTQELRAIETVGELLAREVGAPILGILNHDDDILCYWLWNQGRLIDSYNSCPDYFEEPGQESGDTGGNARTLCEVLSVPGAVDRVEAILRADEYAFAVDRHSHLVEALGLSTYAVGSGYRYVAQGETPEGLSPDQLIRIG
jgi:hypothetical protein